MIYGGLAIFGLTCLWITYKRILRGPLGLILWSLGKLVGSGKAVSTTQFASERQLMHTQTASTVKTSALVETSFQDEHVEGLWTEVVEPGDIVTEIVTVEVGETAAPAAV